MSVDGTVEGRLELCLPLQIGSTKCSVVCDVKHKDANDEPRAKCFTLHLEGTEST